MIDKNLDLSNPAIQPCANSAPKGSLTLITDPENP